MQSPAIFYNEHLKGLSAGLQSSPPVLTEGSQTIHHSKWGKLSWNASLEPLPVCDC
jgi:hypothetical protein